MGKKTDLKDSCAHCGVINCIDLFRHTRHDDKLVGGELYVYKLLNHSEVADREELWRHICSNGALLQCGCYIVGTANELSPEDFLTIICNEIVRDMKASFYLAMSGHYRQAILIQRCVFENFLYGLYFHAEDYWFSRNAEEQEKVLENFMSWINGGFRKSDVYLLDIIERGRIISKAEKREWETLFNELSQFVHTILKTPTGKIIKYGNVEIKSCYSEVEFDSDGLIEWSRYYQKVFFLVLHKLVSIYPLVRTEEAGKLALKRIRAEFKDVREELKNPHLNELLKMRSGKSEGGKLSLKGGATGLRQL